MTIDASAVARVLGIDVQYQDMRGGKTLFLPQRIAVFAQGSGRANYTGEKWTATSAGAAGSRYGFGSPIHLILRELMPANGDGVGTIPVDVYPLEEPDEGTAAMGIIVPSGTATRAASYRIRVNGILSESFVIPKGAVNVSQVNASIGAAINAVLEMPVEALHSYGTVTATPGDNEGNGTVTVLSVQGAPVPGAWTLELKTAVANGGVFKLTNPLGTIVSESITMTPGAGNATVINVADLRFTLTDGTTDFALGDKFTITVPATDTVLVAKWSGTTGNAIKFEVVGESVGVEFDITQPAGGLGVPDITEALARVGSLWVSLAINGAAPIEDTDILDEFQTWGEGRWGELNHRPLVVFTGVTHETVEAATAVSSQRASDRINGQLVAPGSPNLPFVVAARQLARIAKVANNDPARDYGGQRATGLIPGADGAQWNYSQQDLAVKAGSSTTEVRDGVVTIGDVVTFYRPTGEEPPAYRFVKNIVRLQTCIYNVDLAFASQEWDGAPLIPDDQPTVSASARKPSAAKARAAAIVQGLGDNAIISDPKRSQENIVAEISDQNPDRLDIEIPVQLSGNTNVKSVLLKFGFYYGTPALVA